MGKEKMSIDPEKITAERWLKQKCIDVPFVVHPDTGENVYQLKYYPVRPPLVPIKYDRINGLGPFHPFNYRFIREYLDDYLEINEVLTLACVSREWLYFCSDEKYYFFVSFTFLNLLDCGRDSLSD